MPTRLGRLEGSAAYNWVVRRVCLKYGVRWERELIPMRSYMDVRILPKYKLMYSYHGTPGLGSMEAAELLHEVIHIVLGARSFEVCESYVLLPLEWRIALDLSGSMTAATAEQWLQDVELYQENTHINMIQGNSTINPKFKARWRRKKWYREGEQRAVELGMLDQGLRPTWKRPDWRRAPNKIYYAVEET